ncbi:MAG: TraR/DksA family transcriptional regulator [Gammaproteobacteria bacterium]|jgi:RNA polymerase-binding transcription factor DksA|nr:TraR/DksA family transcriptional regulator [Gammaproteobacteria bacterium]
MAPAKKAPAKKASAKKAPAKKAPAKKGTAKKTPAKKAPAKKAPAKKVPAKKAPAKKAPAKSASVSKGRPFPKKSVPAVAAPAVGKGAARSATAVKGGKEKASAAPIASATAPASTTTTSSSAANDGFQRRLLLPPPPKIERKSKHALKPLRDIPTPLIVSGAENPWSKDELKEMKARLTKDLATYKQELASAEAQAAELLQDSSDGAGDDQADAGTKTFEREHELSLVYNAQDLVLQTELALARIAAGTYTKCELCGNPIGKARLQVFPRATLCMLCKQKEERR